jgi:hypothetical protein
MTVVELRDPGGVYLKAGFGCLLLVGCCKRVSGAMHVAGTCKAIGVFALLSLCRTTAWHGMARPSACPHCHVAVHASVCAVRRCGAVSHSWHRAPLVAGHVLTAVLLCMLLYVLSAGVGL